MIAWDIETVTKGVLVDYPTMVSAYDGTTTYVAVGEMDCRDLLSRIKDSGRETVTHNGIAFDIPIVKRWGIDMPLGEDTMYLAYLDDETQELSLQSLAIKYNGAAPWKHDDWATFDEDSHEAKVYAARDVVHTYNLCMRLRELLGDRKQLFDDVLLLAAQAFGVETAKGIYINPACVARERKKAEEVICATDAYSKTSGINLGSSKQVGMALTASGIELPLSEKGNLQTSTHVLKNLRHPFAEMVLKDRKAKKVLSTYVRPYEKIINEGDGRVHPEYTLIRTRTGRSAARNLNVQNLSREFKDFFGAPPGKVLCEYDFSAIEFRVAGWFSQDATILENFKRNPDWDPHFYFASKFYTWQFKSIEEECRGWELWEQKRLKEFLKSHEEWILLRQISKSVNFGLLFMGNGLTLVNYAAGLGIELDIVTADALYKLFHTVFPGFRQYYAAVKEELMRDGQALCPSGHVRHYGDIGIMSYKAQRAALRQCVNVKVQNTAAYIAYIALAELERQGLPHCGFVHDAFYFEFKSLQEATDAKPLIIDIMTKYPVQYMREHNNVNFDIPLCVESKFVMGE